MKSSVPQIILTGSSGFLGQHLLHSLLQQPIAALGDHTEIAGYKIHALYGGNMEGFPEALEQLAARNPENVSLQVHKLDFTNQQEIQTWISENAATADICIHMAAMSSPRTCQDTPEKARALNVPQDFFQGLLGANVPIIALSTDQVYEGTKQGTPYFETDAVKPVNIYGLTKVEMEECLQQLSSSQQKTVPVVLLRSSIILGPKAPILPDKAHGTFLHFCQTREGQVTEFYSDECRSVIAVDNVVAVLRWFLKRLILLEPLATKKDDNSVVLLAGVYNMGGPERISRVDMAQAVFRHFGYKEEGVLVASEKAKLPPGPIPSPLDITMDSTKLYQLTKDEIPKWKSLKETVKWTFSSS